MSRLFFLSLLKSCTKDGLQIETLNANGEVSNHHTKVSITQGHLYTL